MVQSAHQQQTIDFLVASVFVSSVFFISLFFKAGEFILEIDIFEFVKNGTSYNLGNF